MAFSNTVDVKGVMGNKRMHMGTFTNTGGSSGGNLNTLLVVVEGIFIQTGGSAVSADQASVNETLPYDGSAVTIVTTADADGYWLAWGT